MADHRPHRTRSATLQSRRRNCDVDESGPRQNMAKNQTTDTRQSAQPHLCPAPGQCAPGFLCVLGGWPWTATFRVPPLFHQPKRGPCMEAASGHERRICQAGNCLVKRSGRRPNAVELSDRTRDVNLLPLPATCLRAPHRQRHEWGEGVLWLRPCRAVSICGFDWVHFTFLGGSIRPNSYGVLRERRTTQKSDMRPFRLLLLGSNSYENSYEIPMKFL